MNLDCIEKIMLLVEPESFAYGCLINHDWCSIGFDILNRRRESLDADQTLWFVRYLISNIKFPFPKNEEHVEIKPKSWCIAKSKLKLLMLNKCINAYRLYISCLMQREKVLRLFHHVERLELIINDGSSYYKLARYLKKYNKGQQGYEYSYIKYVEYLWEAHVHGSYKAFKMLVKRYKHSYYKLERICQVRTLSHNESLLVLHYQALLIDRYIGF